LGYTLGRFWARIQFGRWRHAPANRLGRVTGKREKLQSRTPERDRLGSTGYFCRNAKLAGTTSARYCLVDLNQICPVAVPRCTSSPSEDWPARVPRGSTEWRPGALSTSVRRWGEGTAVRAATS
jgi:hypothetical protein